MLEMLEWLFATKKFEALIDLTKCLNQLTKIYIYVYNIQKNIHITRSRTVAPVLQQRIVSGTSQDPHLTRPEKVPGPANKLELFTPMEIE